MLLHRITRPFERNDNVTLFFSRFFCYKLNNEPVKRQKKKLRQWRIIDRRPKNFFGLWDRTALRALATDNQEEPKVTSHGSLGMHDNKSKLVLSMQNVKYVLRQTDIEAKKFEQKFDPLRHEILGSDLAAAHFLLFRGGKVKFMNDDKWWEKVEEYDKLPDKYDSRYVLCAVDCTGMELYYEGLQNIENLTRVKWASFKGNPVFDVWCLDRIIGEMPCLEYLDISECPLIDEKALEGLYKLFYLKTLIVTNHHESAALELTCMMLEDCNPNLKCEIIEAKINNEA